MERSQQHDEARESFPMRSSSRGHEVEKNCDVGEQKEDWYGLGLVENEGQEPRHVGPC